jgi:hypothetical protein
MRNISNARTAAGFFLLIALVCKGAISADSIGSASAHSEQRIEALRNALINRAMQAPTRIKSSAWIDQSGRLQESTRITSDMTVRGIRLVANPDAQDVTDEKIIIDAANSVITPEQCSDANSAWLRRAILKIEQHGSNDGISADHMAEIVRATNHLFAETWSSKGSWNLLPASDLNHYEQLVRVGRQVSAPYGITVSIVTAKSEPKLKTTSQNLKEAFFPPSPLLPDSMLILTIILSESASGKTVWSSSAPLHFPATTVSILKRPLPGDISTQLASIISRWKQQVDTKLKCEPIFFNVVNEADGTININAGQASGLRENDKVLVIDQGQVPQHILEGGLDKSVFLAEVESVSNYSSRLRFFSTPPGRNTSRWIAIPF